MGETAINSIENKSILISRNNPVALVVGAAGFLGSHLSEKLLAKQIQVIGVDNFKTGKRLFIEEASKNKNYHFLITDAGSLEIDLPRLDYIFIAAGEEVRLAKVLAMLEKHKSRVVLLSSIELYGSNQNERLKKLKKAEEVLAKFAFERKINARILRLGPVFGPRMNFRLKDPIFKLIGEAINGKLQKNIPLEFSTRALYIDDAVELILKTVLSGATAQKIFDGCLSSPIEIAEVKQILLDPLWYENKGFTPNELPPWNTPNLEKTMKILNWKPRKNLVSSLKDTLTYFRQNGIDYLDEQEEAQYELNDEKKHQLEEFKAEGIKEGNKKETKKEKISKKNKIKFPFGTTLRLCLLSIFIYVVIWPMLSFSYGIYTFQSNLKLAVESFEKGELEKTFSYIKDSKRGLTEAENTMANLQSLKEVKFFDKYLERGVEFANISNLSLSAVESSARGVKNLYEGFKAVTGETTKDGKDFFDLALVDLSVSGESFAKIDIKLSDELFINSYPDFVKTKLISLRNSLKRYKKIVDSARSTAILLPAITGEGIKSYLVLLQNNGELRPTGGFIGSVAKITFENGKLKKIDANDVYELDGQMSTHVEPPKEIKEELGIKDWYLRDSNWEPDFPTAARQAEWFLNKEVGGRVNGVIAIDISAIEDLLSVIGALNIADYDKKITDSNLFEEAVTHAEVGFFPGSQAKKSFLTALENQLFNKLFFVPNQNWPGIVASIGKSLEQKHISVYLNDPKLFSYVVSQNWQASLPRVPEEVTGQTTDLLVPVEANLGANKANYYLDRKYYLDTVIGREGEIRHSLKISYTNRSPADTFPAGKYKNRMRVYMPFGARLSRVLWGGEDITKSVTSFADYGRSAISFLIELPAKESRNLVIDYALSTPLSFKDNKAVYRLDVIKQAGTLKDLFDWKLSYPIHLKVSSKEVNKNAPQTVSIETDLSTDKSFEVEFRK